MSNLKDTFFIQPGEHKKLLSVQLSLAEVKRLYSAIASVPGWENTDSLVNLRTKLHGVITLKCIDEDG